MDVDSRTVTASINLSPDSQQTASQMLDHGQHNVPILITCELDTAQDAEGRPEQIASLAPMYSSYDQADQRRRTPRVLLSPTPLEIEGRKARLRSQVRYDRLVQCRRREFLKSLDVWANGARMDWLGPMPRRFEGGPKVQRWFRMAETEAGFTISGNPVSSDSPGRMMDGWNYP